MVYREGYVVTVRQGGQTLQETTGKVVLPFHSEYELRVRNKTPKDAVAFVYIDGQLATKGGVVVKGDTFLDLERFIEDDLSRGKKFKFVPLEDGRVKDKGEHENGNIEVRFHRVIPLLTYGLNLNPPIEKHIHHHHYPHVPYDWDRPKIYPGRGEIWCSANQQSGALGGSSGSAGYASSPAVTNTGMSNARAPIANLMALSAGATVGGSESKQAFNTISVDYEKDTYVTVTVQLVGRQEETAGKRYCANCGTSQNGGRFCTGCGTRF